MSLTTCEKDLCIGSPTSNGKKICIQPTDMQRTIKTLQLWGRLLTSRKSIPAMHRRHFILARVITSNVRHINNYVHNLLMIDHLEVVSHVRYSLSFQTQDFGSARKAIILISSCFQTRHIVCSNINTDESKHLSQTKLKNEPYQLTNTAIVFDSSKLYCAINHAGEYAM